MVSLCFLHAFLVTLPQLGLWYVFSSFFFFFACCKVQCGVLVFFARLFGNFTAAGAVVRFFLLFSFSLHAVRCNVVSLCFLHAFLVTLPQLGLWYVFFLVFSFSLHAVRCNVVSLCFLHAFLVTLPQLGLWYVFFFSFFLFLCMLKGAMWCPCVFCTPFWKLYRSWGCGTFLSSLFFFFFACCKVQCGVLVFFARLFGNFDASGAVVRFCSSLFFFFFAC